jgi:hypothetical protein
MKKMSRISKCFLKNYGDLGNPFGTNRKGHLRAGKKVSRYRWGNTGNEPFSCKKNGFINHANE